MLWPASAGLLCRRKKNAILYTVVDDEANRDGNGTGYNRTVFDVKTCEI